MKNSKQLAFALIAGTMMVASCDSDDIAINSNVADKVEEEIFTSAPSDKAVSIITAYTQSDDSSTAKTTLDGYNVKWSENDKILVWAQNSSDPKNGDKYSYVLSQGAGTTKGTFVSTDSYDPQSNFYAAFYPLDGLTGCQFYSDGIIFFQVPAQYEQKVLPGESMARNAMLMGATSTDLNNFSFKNLMSLIKVTTINDKCSKIKVSTSAGYLASTYTNSILFADGTIGCGFAMGGMNYVTLESTDGNLAAGTYYIVVPPNTVEDLTVQFYDSNDIEIGTKKRPGTFTFVANKIYNAGNQPSAPVDVTKDFANYSPAIAAEGVESFSYDMDDVVRMEMTGDKIKSDDKGVYFYPQSNGVKMAVKFTAKEGYEITKVVFKGAGNPRDLFTKNCTVTSTNFDFPFMDYPSYNGDPASEIVLEAESQSFREQYVQEVVVTYRKK